MSKKKDAPRVARSLEELVVGALPDFRALDRELVVDGKCIAELLGELDGRLALVVESGDGADRACLRALDALAFCRRHGAALARHVELEDAATTPVVLLLVPRIAPELRERLGTFLGERVLLFERHELASARGLEPFVARDPLAASAPAPSAAFETERGAPEMEEDDPDVADDPGARDVELVPGLLGAWRAAVEAAAPVERPARARRADEQAEGAARPEAGAAAEEAASPRRRGDAEAATFPEEDELEDDAPADDEAFSRGDAFSRADAFADAGPFADPELAQLAEAEPVRRIPVPRPASERAVVPFLDELSEADRALAGDLIARLDRVDPALLRAPRGDTLVWTIDGEPLCSLRRDRDGGLEGRLEGSEVPHSIHGATAVDVFLDWVLGQHLERLEAREGPPLVQVELQPVASEPLLTIEELDAFRE